MGEPELAASYLRDALDVDGDTADAWRDLADVASEIGRDDEALAAADRALELDPDMWKAKEIKRRLEGASDVGD